MNALLWTVLWLGGVPPPAVPAGPASQAGKMLAVKATPSMEDADEWSRGIIAQKISRPMRKTRRPELYAILQQYSLASGGYDYRREFDYPGHSSPSCPGCLRRPAAEPIAVPQPSLPKPPDPLP